SDSATVSDITLTGAAERIVGSDDETGTVTYSAVPTANRLDLNLTSGTRSEIHVTGSSSVGNWIGPDGVVHPIAQHNLFTEAGWFPLFTLITARSSVLTFVGPEIKNGTAVIHIRSERPPDAAFTSIAALAMHLTQ